MTEAEALEIAIENLERIARQCHRLSLNPIMDVDTLKTWAKKEIEYLEAAKILTACKENEP